MLIKIPELTNGYNVITQMEGVTADMLMDIGVYRLPAGKSAEFNDAVKESAFLLMNGSIKFEWEGKSETASRSSLLDENPTVLHVCKDTAVTITALTDAEFLIQQTDNDRVFESRFYAPEDCSSDVFGKDVWNDMARRTVRTVFDLSNAPYSNMVIGEVINYPGRWSSFIPHGHDQPEVYYYRFERPEGFGAAFIGDEAYKIVDNSALCIPGGPTHPQATAPGYPMWYCWMIRHLDGNPWDKRVNDTRYEWLLEDNVKIWPEK